MPQSILLEEIHEQPGVIARLLERQAEHVGAIARALRAREIRFVVIAARGSSDNAARYAQYLFGSQNGMTVALATPSLFTRSGGLQPSMRDALVIGVSQSGQSPDIVEVLKAARRDGAATVAITNDAASPLAGASESVIALGAETERSVAATKTYTAQLTALAMLSSLWRDQTLQPALRALPDAMRTALTSAPQTRIAAAVLAKATRCVVLSRGFHYATAFEISLKIKELTYLLAEPYSTADFKHGPMAMIEAGFPVLVIAAGSANKPEFDALRATLRTSGATVVVLGDSANPAQTGEHFIALPDSLPETLSPIAAILPGQLLAYHLARARGIDPDQPRTISKVTLTR